MHVQLTKAGLRTLVLGGAFIWGTASAAGAVTIAEAVQLAVSTNPNVKAFAESRRAVDEELRQALGLYLPQVDATAGFGREYTRDFRTRAQEANNDIYLWRSETSLQLTQRLFTGFDTTGRINQQKKRVLSAAHRANESAQVIGAEATAAFIDVRRQRALKKLSEGLVQAHQDILSSIKRRATAGAGSEADVAQTEVRLNRALAIDESINNDLRDAEAAYLRIVGQAPADLEEPAPPFDKLPNSIEEALERVSGENPGVLTRRADIRIAEAEVTIAEAPNYPAVNLELLGSYNENIDGLDDTEYIGQAMVRMRWNLYRGGTDAANIREAKTRVNGAKSRLDESIILSQQRMRIAWNRYMSTAERVGYLREAVEFSKRTRKAYERQFVVGQRTLLDVLDAETELFSSRTQLISEQAANAAASYQIMALYGGLLRELNVTPPDAAEPTLEKVGKWPPMPVGGLEEDNENERRTGKQ